MFVALLGFFTVMSIVTAATQPAPGDIIPVLIFGSAFVVIFVLWFIL